MKFTKLALAAVMATSLVACSNNTASSSTAASSASSAEEVVNTGSYTLTNVARTAITELYVYQTGTEDKGENLAPAEGLGRNESVEVNVGPIEDPTDYALTVEFVDENGENVVVFDNLHLEEATLILQAAADVEAGATPFFQKGEYGIANASGTTITELYFYQTGSDEKGDNLLTADLADGEELAEPIAISVASAQAANYHMTVEYVTADGDSVVVFDNLSIEVANLTLKSAADVEAGATPFN